MSLFDNRLTLRPATYPHILETLDKAVCNPWNHKEVSMAADVLNWQQITKGDRKAIGGILKGFTVTEGLVGNQWSTLSLILKNVEAVGLCTTYASQEVIHALAYDMLEATLGLNSYQDFKADPNAVNRYLSIAERSLRMPGMFDKDNSSHQTQLLRSLVFFGGFVEGISLYSSFAFLLSYARTGKFLGLRQLISWSVRDEKQHSDFAIDLYHLLSEEFGFKLPELAIVDLLDAGIKYELSFIKNVFDGLKGEQLSIDLTYPEFEAFIYHRADKKLKDLGCSGKYYEDLEDTKLSKKITGWFYSMVESGVYHDFFVGAKDGGSYTQTIQGIDSVDNLEDLF